MTAKLFLTLIVCLFLNGCVSRDSLPRNYRSFDAKNIPNAIPKVEPKSRYGNPASYVVRGKRYYVLKSAHCYHAKGIASWYGTAFHCRLTSSREPYNMYKMTAASKVLPLPTYVRVTNLENGKKIIVKVNDRGPFHVNRIIDLSFAAAKKIGMLGKGTAPVEVEAIDPRHPNASCEPKTKHMKQKPKLYLQLGVFSEKHSANKLANKLAKKTKAPIHVIIIKQQQKYLYKVQIGPIKNVDAVDHLTDTLKAEGFGEAYAVVR